MTPAYQRSLRIFTAITTAAIVVIPACALPSAVAAPGDGGSPSQSPVLALPTLGAGDTLSFFGQQGTQTVTIPVPSGLAPSELRATVELPPNLQGGSISAVQQDRTLSRVDVPTADRAPITIPLRGASVVENSVAITLQSFLEPTGGLCVFDKADPMRLTDASVAFTGTETAPMSVAEFLPPVLEKLTVSVPETPSQSESNAAVALSSAVVAYYGAQPVEVLVQGLPAGRNAPDTPSAPLERQITIIEQPTSGVTLLEGPGVPALVISGPAAELSNQTLLLTSDISRLAVSSRAVAGPLRVSPQLPPDSTTLRDLGEPGISATALTDPQVSIGIDQTRLGRPAGNIRVNLKGSYTPLPPNYGGQVVVSVGDQVISRWVADPNGTIDKWVDIPDRLLQRFTDLNVAVDAAGDTGGCGQSSPITLTIDGDSPVQSTPADPPVPPGFQSIPQAFMPSVQIGLTVGSLADTARASSIVTGLQRLSSVPIETTVVPLGEAVSSSNPAILISADGWNEPGIDLPVSTTAGGPIDIEGVESSGEKTTLTLDPAVAFGSLQTVRDGDRTVLVASSTGAAGQLDSLLRWLEADEERWITLNGNALIAVPDRDPIAMITDADSQQSTSGDDDNKQLVRWIGAGVLVAIALGVGFLILRSRRREPGS
ncbi:hypothetical protein [Gordonia rubripertincta]|uniref:Cellulose biosynthesis cyclic di-GMP-binding regulatory protein BcsB n=1 Tax=Gordonia rubripertincta TaxID=36822 RepID=A0ABT4N144_GORRU|nr:hypothetical protein [Gordonia rubripertincta]MCZ4552789.1 hypothetical protein [Gordonia rubripertincta]